MKKILVPTDFSEYANTALRYAINIGNYFNAKIYVLHVYDSISTTGTYDKVRTFIKENAERALADNVRSFTSTIYDKIILEERAIDGNAVDVICSIAAHEKMDMIIMGTQGASGLKEIFLGSNTFQVMNKTEVPLLAIPQGFKYRPIKDILLPVDSGIVANSDTLNPLIELAKAYDSEIKVMHLETEKMVVGYDPGIDIKLGEVPHSFHRVIGSNDDTNDVINSFVEEDDSDLLCMIRRKRGFWEKLFHKSVTTREIFNSPVPLLILHSE